MTPARIAELAAIAALVVCRLAGFLVISPFPGRWVPARIRALVVLAIAVPLSFGTHAVGHVGLDIRLFVLAISDFVLGLLIGASFYLILVAAEVMGGMVSQASWLQAPTSLSPDLDGQKQVLAQVAMLFAVLLSINLGTHRIVLAYLLESFRALPVGTTIAPEAAVPSLIELAGRSFDVGMRLAVAVFAVSLAVQAALALVSRVAPSLQIFSIGFAVLVIIVGPVSCTCWPSAHDGPHSGGAVRA